MSIGFCPGVGVHNGVTTVLSLFRSHWLAVVYCLVLCSGSCKPLHEDRTVRCWVCATRTYWTLFFNCRTKKVSQVLEKMYLVSTLCTVCSLHDLCFGVSNKHATKTNLANIQPSWPHFWSITHKRTDICPSQDSAETYQPHCPFLVVCSEVQLVALFPDTFCKIVIFYLETSLPSWNLAKT